MEQPLGFDAVTHRLASIVGAEPGPEMAAIGVAPGSDPLAALEARARALGLEAHPLRASIAQAARRATPSSPYVTVGPDGRPWVLLGRLPGLLRVENASGRRRWSTPLALRRRLGGERRPCWIAVRAPFTSRLGPEGLGSGKPTPLQRTRMLLRLERGDLGVVLVYAVALGLLSLAVPIAVQAFVNTVAFGMVLQPLVVITVLLAVALVAGAGLRALQLRVVEMLQRRLFVRVSTELADRLPRVRSEALVERHGQDLLNRFFDVFTLQKAVSALVIEGSAAALIALVGMVLLAFYHPLLLAFDVALILTCVVLFSTLGRRGTATTVAESKAKYAVAGWLEEMARHGVALKMVGGRQHARRRAEALAAEYLHRRDEHFRVVFRLFVGALVVEVLASVTLLALGGFLVLEGQLTLGQLVAAELVVAAVVAAIAKLGGKIDVYYDMLAAVDKLGELLDLPLEATRTDGADLERSSDTPVGLRGVRLTEGDDVLLDGVDLDVPAGTVSLIFSRDERPTSALVEMLFGIREPAEGHWTIEGQDSRDVSLDHVRSRVAVVRDGEAWPTTVGDNVRAGGPSIGPARIWALLERVGLAERIRSLRAGLDTPLAAGGSPLTRGEVVRLSLARALAADPVLLVVDRALDGFDDGTRQGLLAGLRGPEGRTVLVVTSRRGGLEDADVLHVVRDARLLKGAMS